MHQRIDKTKFIFYVLIFLFLSSINNISLIKVKEDLSRVTSIEVNGLSNNLNFEVEKKLEFLLNRNIYKLDREIINKELNSYNYLDNYKVFKRYPSKIIIELKQTKFLATTLKNNKKYIIGSNGKLINYKIFNYEKDIPKVFGKFSKEDFISLNEILNKSNFKFQNIENIFFFPSGRMDIKTKNNLLVKLPKQNIDNAINKFNLIVQSNELKEYNVIDLRIDSQVILSHE